LAENIIINYAGLVSHIRNNNF